MFRYHLPFITATHHACSPWSGKSTQLSLLSGLPAEALRIAWNVAWHEGIEEAIAGNNSSSDRYNELHLLLCSTVYDCGSFCAVVT